MSSYTLVGVSQRLLKFVASIFMVKIKRVSKCGRQFLIYYNVILSATRTAFDTFCHVNELSGNGPIHIFDRNYGLADKCV